MQRKIELLLPAKNLDCGLAAINHGADAVYMGASKFGARAAAGNSLQDMEQLTAYAHRFNACVYATLNTILADSELEEARQLIWQLYNIGVDAIIIQDMGLLQLDLPPVALHASTQTDNRTLEKVQFLEKAGFSQVVLARELSLEQIKHISDNTTVPLEFFVHGALCVSYSGQCYISQALCKRSANRGECAQYCRLPYNLVDSDGTVLVKNKHLLSLKDLDLSAYLSDLLDAGISSFKIEGRLKDADYVKNTTAFYRQKLDAIFEKTDKYKKSSSGKTTFFFTPNPEKTFSRGATSYFLTGRHAGITSFDTPKSIGEYVGTARETGERYLCIDTQKQLHNGDGLCFLNTRGEFLGFRANRVEGKTVFFTGNLSIQKGTDVYRNLDVEFEKQLTAAKTAERKIRVNISFSDSQGGFLLKITDEDQNAVSIEITTEKLVAQQPEKTMETIRTQLSKLGNTDFVAQKIEIETSQPYFIPASILADMRRQGIEQLEKLRQANYFFSRKKMEPTYHLYPQTELTYLGNVHNQLAVAFYQQHGVKRIDFSFEKQPVENEPLMFTRHCLKYSLGACTRYSPKPVKTVVMPLFLEYQGKELILKFDCIHCQMLVF